MHRTARAGRIGVFELKTIVFAAEAYQQIQFGATMRCPKVGVARAKQPTDLLQRKAFPRGAELGMGLEIGQGAQLQQSVQEAAVTDINLGRFDLSFANVFKPGGRILTT